MLCLCVVSWFIVVKNMNETTHGVSTWDSCFEKLKNYQLAIELKKQEISEKMIDSVSVEQFFMGCVEKLDNVAYVLYSDLSVCITKHFNTLSEHEGDWELLFCLLYTHSFKFKISSCVIYRRGKYHSDFMTASDLTPTELNQCEKEIAKIRKDCWRHVTKIKDIINEVFESMDVDSFDFKMVSKKKHELLSVNKQLRMFFKSFDNVSRLTNLRKAVQPGVPLQILVTPLQSKPIKS